MTGRETRRYGSCRINALAAAFGIGMLILLPCHPASADQEQMSPMMAVGYQSGMITGIYETTLQIDHKTYSMTPDVVLLNRHGHELHPRHLRVDIEVKYHLPKDSKDKIDRMILILPE